jgi:transcriptional regulator with XRE-family HTH domain
MNFGRRVELARQELKLTRSQLSLRIGISEGSLRDLEILNSTPRGLQELIPRLSNSLGKSIKFLLTGTQAETTIQLIAEADKIIGSANNIKNIIE